jgi:hypothetical protein
MVGGTKKLYLKYGVYPNYRSFCYYHRNKFNEAFPLTALLKETNRGKYTSYRIDIKAAGHSPK